MTKQTRPEPCPERSRRDSRRKPRIPGMAWVFIGFMPWIIYWSLSGPGLDVAAMGVCRSGEAARGSDHLPIWADLEPGG